MSRPVPFTQAELDAAETKVAEIIEIGERGTRGDHTEIGALASLFQVLGIRPTIIDAHGWVHADDGTVCEAGPAEGSDNWCDVHDRDLTRI